MQKMAPKGHIRTLLGPRCAAQRLPPPCSTSVLLPCVAPTLLCASVTDPFQPAMRAASLPLLTPGSVPWGSALTLLFFMVLGDEPVVCGHLCVSL